MPIAFFAFLMLFAMPGLEAFGTAATPYTSTQYTEIFKRKPDIEAERIRIWTIHKTPVMRVDLVELKGQMPLHKHPDADHSVMVLEGKMRVQVGDARFLAVKGDFISIPLGTPHKYWPIGGKVRLVSMDAPYYDRAKVVKLE
jgi:quercetin dioxygenase-like cupin family protein